MPTSYYATVQLEGDVRLVDDPAAKAALLQTQLRHFEPDGSRAPVSATEAPDRRLLPGIRGIEFTITGVRAKFKFGGNKAAGTRVRKKMQEIKSAAQEVRKKILEGRESETPSAGT